MQNTMMKYELLDNSVDQFITISPTKQQMFFMPTEESQMFQSRSYTSAGGPPPAGYLSDPATETERREAYIGSVGSDNHFVGPFMPSQYIGMAVYDLPTLIDENFANIKLLNNGVISPFYSSFGNITNLMNGLQLVKVPATEFASLLTDPVAIAANGGSLLWNYMTYFMIISPKYVQSNITQIDERRHFPFENLGDDEVIGVNILPIYKRRNIYYCPNSDFTAQPWNFEGQTFQAGRLIGSVVEIWDSSGSTLKQQKVMNENDFGFGTGSSMSFVLSPDNVGYDSIGKDPQVGDIIRVYPIETNFNQIVIEIDFVDKLKTTKAAIQFMTNDVARDMTTATYEIYDDNGLTVDPTTGIVDGTVVQKYQIAQYGNTEIRKRINN